MDKFLEQLLSSDLLTEDTKNELRESFKTVIAEAQNAARDEERNKLAEQYNRDKEQLINCLDMLVRESITSHLVEFKEDVDRLHTAKAKAAKAIAEADTRASRKVATALSTIEEANKKVIKSEIGELVEDFKQQRSQHVKLMKEGRAKLARQEKALVTKMAKVLEHLSRKELRSIMETYKEDIRKARENDFGRKIFEAFVSEFETSHFSRDKILDALKTQVAETENKLKEVKKNATKQISTLKESAAREAAKREKLTESVRRSQKMNSLLKPLSGSARTQMKELLEGVPSEKMDRTFRTYLKIVTESSSTGKGRKVLSESKRGKANGFNQLGNLQTGNSNAVVTESQDDEKVIEKDIIDLQRRSGIRRA